MGVEIDWSKAPETAIAALVRQPLFVDRVETFHEAGIEYFCGEDVSGLPYRLHVGRVTKVDRPSTWTGEGLPPVGMECEVKNDINDGWDRVDEVLAHTTIKGAVVAVFKRDDRVFYSPADAFRALRTPEQIAAEQRARAIDEMWSVYWQPDAPTAKEALGLLYDAGYRKVAP